MSKFLLVTFVVISGLIFSAGGVLAEGTMIAFYSLNQTATDMIGINGDANIVNAPYEEGGVYLNGNYVGTESDSAMVKTPTIAMLDFSSLSVRVDFKISELPSTARPILFCGASWRWMGATLTTNGQIYLNYNGYTGPACVEVVTPGVWHTLAMTHDGTTGRVLLDGVEVLSKDFVPYDGNDRKFVTQNGSNGTAFKGHIRNLVIYNGVVQFVAGVESEGTPVAQSSMRNYPNPFNPATTIAFELPTASTTSLGVYDISGRLVKSLLVGESMVQGSHEIMWDGTDLRGRLMPSGTYFYRLDSGGPPSIGRMTMLK